LGGEGLESNKKRWIGGHNVLNQKRLLDQREVGLEEQMEEQQGGTRRTSKKVITAIDRS